MIRNSIKVLQNFNHIKTHCKASVSSSSILQEKWDLFAAVCLERKPIITPELNETEREFKQVLAELEFERSLKSAHEVRLENEKKQLELLKNKDVEESEVSLKQTAQDLLDMWTDELNKFNPANRITEADKTSDLKSLERKLDKHLVLVIRKNTSKSNFFILPQELRQDGETLRQTANRVLQQYCGPNLTAQIYGNAPCGFYKYKYPQKIRESKSEVGAKVFIYFARYIKGNLSDQKEIDYKWLDMDEMETVIRPNDHKAVSQFLVD